MSPRTRCYFRWSQRKPTSNVSGTGSDTAVLVTLREQRAILEEQISNEATHAQAEMRRLDSLVLGLRDQADALASQRRLQVDRVAAAQAMLTRVAPLREERHRLQV